MNPYASTYINGFKDYPKFIINLGEAINEQAGAITFYEKLMKLAPNEKQKGWIDHARKDARKHLEKFSALYLLLTCQSPNVKAKDITFANYKAGVALALDNALASTELYRDMYLATIIPEVRDIFFEAMTDEMEDSIKFSHIYNQL
jgi:rubrerythrin